MAWLFGLAIVLSCFAFSLRFLDGPLIVLHGGTLRSGELVDYGDVDWRALDALRELELELTRTGRSRLLWFSVSDERPYISCGFSCDDGWLTRWPHHLDHDPRIVVRINGVRVHAQAERVAHGSAEYIAARSARRAKFGGQHSQERAERGARDAIVQLGSEISGEANTSDRLYRIVAP